MPRARRRTQAGARGAKLARRLLLRRALSASTLIWLPSWVACTDDDAPAGDGRHDGDGAAGGPGDAAQPSDAGPDASRRLDAGNDAGGEPTRDAGTDAGAVVYDSCEPFLTPLASFFVATGGNGTVQDWAEPDLDAARYRLVVDGEVATPLSLTLGELAAMSPQQSVLKTMECVFGLRSTGLYRGIPVRALLELAGIDRGATRRVRFHGADGFGNNLRLGDLYPASEPAEPRFEPLVALQLNGQPLGRDHGFPARLTLPDRFGFKNTKWLARIEATPSDDPFGDYQDFGLASDEAVIPANTAYRGERSVHAGAAGAITLCGQAQSGVGGIDRVELSIDGGDYAPARIVPLARLLAAEPSLAQAEQVKRGWPYPFLGVATLWEHDLIASPGAHTVRVRVFDRGGGSAEGYEVTLDFDDETDADAGASPISP